MLACSRDTGTSLTQKNWKERDHSTSVCAVIHCNRNYNVLAVTRIKNLHEKKKKKKNLKEYLLSSPQVIWSSSLAESFLA